MNLDSFPYITLQSFTGRKWRMTFSYPIQKVYLYFRQLSGKVHVLYWNTLADTKALISIFV